MFNCKMTDEPTMATAEEDAQRVYAKKLAADREIQKRKRAEESKEQQVFWHRLFEHLHRLLP